MTEQNRNKRYWLLKIASVFVSCALPIWAICEKFPIWVVTHGAGRSIGAGVILIGIVLLIIFRRAVFDFIKDKLNLKHTPPLTVWLVMLVFAYIMVYIGEFMRDVTTVLWMGFIGCAIGTFLTYLSDKYKA